MSKTKEPSQRQLRVGEEIRHILADVFVRQDYQIPELSGVSVTVSEVDVAPDLRNATAYVSSLGGALDEKVLIAALNENVYEFNNAVARKLTMKFTPKLKFSSDTRFDYAARIEELLNKANKQ